MFGLGLPEILLIVVVLVLLFGAKRIPELASGIGSGIRNFKKSMNEEEPEHNNKISKEK